MWQQNYVPLAGSLSLSTVAAAIPIFVMLYLLGIKRKPAWMSALLGLLASALVATLVYHMPVRNLVGSITYGAAYGLFPIGWIVFSAILLYRITLESGKFEVIKDSVGHLTEDRRLQVLLIAFAFSAFVEGGAGFGTPIAVAATMLVGLGFAPFYAAGLCLLANTAPVAFGSIGIPVVTLAATTGLPLDRLSAGVGRMCAPVALFLPAYIMLVMGGWKALKGVLPAAIVCGGTFGVFEFLISNYVSPQLTALLEAPRFLQARRASHHQARGGRRALFRAPADDRLGTLHSSGRLRPAVGLESGPDAFKHRQCDPQVAMAA
jgi:lactate permease